MFRWLRKKIRSVFTKAPRPTVKKSKIQPPTGIQSETQPLATKKAALKYCLATVFFFGMHGILALAGALELVFPNLPTLVLFRNGRAVHLNQAVLWPLLGTMGIAYYYLLEAIKTELHSTRIAAIQFWLLIFTFLGNYTALALGFTEGREYLEAPLPFKLGILLGLTLFAYNIIRTVLKKPKSIFQPASIIIISGTLLTIFLLAPNLFFITHPIPDKLLTFWISHLWEEATLELLLVVAIVGALLNLTEAKKSYIKKLLFIQATLIVLAGFLAVGHHYYWTGTPNFWLYIGGIFSVVQAIPAFLSVLIIWEALKTKRIENPAFNFLLGSVFWNVVGVGMLGLLIATPFVNRWVHGTYLTSTHAHLALFGFFGQGVIGICAYIISNYATLDKKAIFRANLSFWLINLGLAGMEGAIAIAGLLQTYLWYGAGWEFMKVQFLLRPYLFVRLLAGLMFTAGGVIFAYTYISKYITARKSAHK